MSDQRPRITIKERKSEELADIAAMSDDDLAFEAANLAENIESLQVELRLYYEGQTEHDRGWQVKAERALTVRKGRASLCKIEQVRRRKEDEKLQAEERRQDEERRQIERDQQRAKHLEFIRQSQEFKRARIESTQEIERTREKSFVRHAQRMLPYATFKEIWDAVAAEEKP